MRLVTSDGAGWHFFPIIKFPRVLFFLFVAGLDDGAEGKPVACGWED